MLFFMRLISLSLSLFLGFSLLNPCFADDLGLQKNDTTKAIAIKKSIGRDTLKTPIKALAKDTTIRNSAYHLDQSDSTSLVTCVEPLNSPLNCFRNNAALYSNELPNAGLRAKIFSLQQFKPIPYRSVYFPLADYSPYQDGGLIPALGYHLDGQGHALAVREDWQPISPLDTPITHLNWSKGALAYNTFHVNLRRMLSEKTYIAIDYWTASADSQFFDYPFQTHQPFLSGWGFLGKLYKPIDRDSASLVLQGYSHYLNAQNMRVRLGYWLDTNSVAEFFMDKVENKSSLTYPRNLVKHDSEQALMPSGFNALTLGGIYSAWTPNVSYRIRYRHASFVREESLNDSSHSARAALHKQEGDWQDGEVSARLLKVWGLPRIYASGQSEIYNAPLYLGFDNKPSPSGWSDKEALGLQWQPRWRFLQGEVLSESHRHSLMHNKQIYLFDGQTSLALDLPWGFSAEASMGEEQKAPTPLQMYRLQPNYGFYPNANLQPEKNTSIHGGLKSEWSWLTLSGGLEMNSIQEAWLPLLSPDPNICQRIQNKDSADITLPSKVCIDSAKTLVPDSLGLKLVNRDANLDLFYIGMELRLGHWELGLKNNYHLVNEVQGWSKTKLLSNRALSNSIYKGHLGWKKLLVDNKLKVKLDWDWEWFGTRYAWASDGQGNSSVVKLDEYLALDFKAQMQIKSFIFFFKAVNFNHDRYSPEPGVHPPGVIFRFGVDWTLLN